MFSYSWKPTEIDRAEIAINKIYEFPIKFKLALKKPLS